LFLALLAKTAGIEQPVVWTREHYDSTAVGTNKQAAYISGFDVAEVRYKVRWAAWLMRVGIELY
jgi:ABC-type xylose transport system permease subunit